MKKWAAQTNIFKFIIVMDLPSWLCILAAFFFTAFLIWSFDKISPNSLQNSMKENKDEVDEGVADERHNGVKLPVDTTQ